MLGTPNIPSVGLVRRLRHFVSANEDEQTGSNVNSGTSWDHWAYVPYAATVGKNLHSKTMLHKMGTAAWWDLDVRNEPNTRHLQGEIHLSPDLEPSCACKIFTVEVN